MSDHTSNQAFDLQLDHEQNRCTTNVKPFIERNTNKLINISEIVNHKPTSEASQTPKAVLNSTYSNWAQPSNSLGHNVHQIDLENSKRIKFNSLLAPSVISGSDEISDTSRHELVNFNNFKLCDSINCDTNLDIDSQNQDTNQQKFLLDRSNSSNADIEDHSYSEVSESSTDDGDRSGTVIGKLNIDGQQFETSSSPSRYKSRQSTITGRLITKLKFIGTGLTNKISGAPSTAYTPYENDNKVLLSGATKYRISKHARRQSTGRTFRGSYRYSRIGIVMGVFKKLFSFLIQRSTLALFGAFLIHVTLGTVYTLSNINSYLTSYMRKHGTPDATYGGSMWISSSYAVGQGLSMVLGGYLERRFSARLSCILGCILHSMSIMSTSRTIDHGRLAVLVSYGFLPGFGCGLAYMTPMSNGFGWFPNRKGLVAGVILAGFGIGTFVFNMAQTAFVNPENLSPPDKSGGYFTQDSVLDNVPQLFVFLGLMYASMQFIGCCLLFKPPNDSDNKSSDVKPILVESEITFDKAIRTREFIVLFLVFGITNQGVLFVNSMLKEYGQIFINNDLFLAWAGSMASIANSLGRLVWGMAIDRYSFTQCFTAITTIFGTLMFIMPFEFILSSKLLYLLCTLGIFGSFSGWMSTYPVHLSRIFGLEISGMIYGLIFVSQVSVY